MDARELLEYMPQLLNPSITRRVRAKYYFKFSGEEPGDYSLTINNGNCVFSEGIPDDPSITIDVPSEIWMGISAGVINPRAAMKGGQLKVKGKFLLLLRFNKYFSGDSKATFVPEGLYGETENERNIRLKKWDKPKKVLGIQAAPRGKKGATEMVYSSLISGMKDEGVKVDTIYLAEKKINQCRGCYHCWKSDDGFGDCVFKDKDEMHGILKMIPEYDLMVFATPLYVDGVSGLLKNFIDRMIPLNHPYIFLKDGHSRHPSRFSKLPNLVLTSVCGFYEIDNFDPLVHHIKAMGENMHIPLIAAVLRPTSMVALNSDLHAVEAEKIRESISLAGMEIVKGGKVPRKLTKLIQRPILPKGHYYSSTKTWWKNWM